MIHEEDCYLYGKFQPNKAGKPINLVLGIESGFEQHREAPEINIYHRNDSRTYLTSAKVVSNAWNGPVGLVLKYQVETHFSGTAAKPHAN